MVTYHNVESVRWRHWCEPTRDIIAVQPEVNDPITVMEIFPRAEVC